MLRMEFEFEGIEGLQSDLNKMTDLLAADLSRVVYDAAQAGVVAMRENHPYQDRTFLLTDGMHAKPFGRTTRTRAEAIIIFKAKYAKYVNDGTTKSKPYPFLPIGEKAAGIALMTGAFEAVSTFIRTIGMKR